MVRVLVWGTRGPRFESALPDHAGPRRQRQAVGWCHPAASAPTAPARRLVVFTPYACAPPRHGPQMRIAGLLRHLGPHWEVEHYSQSIQRTDLPWPPRSVRGGERWVEHRLRDPVSAAWLVGVAKLTGYPPVYADRLLSLVPRPRLKRALAYADVVVVSPHYQYRWVRSHAPSGLPIVVDCHAIEHLVWPPRRRWWTRVFSTEIATGEIEAWRHANVVFATCEKEAEIIRGVGASRVEVVPNGVDTRRIRPADGEEERTAIRRQLGISPEAIVALFVGSAGYANRHAVDVLEERAAALAALGIEVHVVGRVGIGRRPRRGMRFWGEVPDVAPWLRSADIALCPLLNEGGTNGTSLKTVEYLAAGLPVVGTPAGVRGLPVRNGVEALVCPLDDLVAAVGTLGSDAPRRRALGLAARELAERHLSWERIGARATAVLDDLAAQRERSVGRAATGSGPGR